MIKIAHNDQYNIGMETLFFLEGCRVTPKTRKRMLPASPSSRLESESPRPSPSTPSRIFDWQADNSPVTRPKLVSRNARDKHALDIPLRKGIQAQETVSSNDWQAVNSPVSSRKRARGEHTPVKRGVVETQNPVTRSHVASPCVPLYFEGWLSVGNSDQGYEPLLDDVVKDASNISELISLAQAAAEADEDNGARIPTSDAPAIFSVGLAELY